MKHFLLRDSHKLYYYRTLVETLKEKPHFVSNECIAKLRSVFNAIPAKFTYLKSAKKDRQRSRVWSVKTERGLELTRSFRKLLKYKAMQYNKQRIEPLECEWKWIGDGVENDNEDTIEYEAISNGSTEFKIGDIITTHTYGKTILQLIRPWIARIVGLHEDTKDHSKRVKLRWFWFWNQIMDENQNENEINELCADAKESFGDDRYPPTKWDVFENVINDESYENIESVEVMKKVVFVIDDNEKYEHLVDGQNVFYCDHYYDHTNKMFIKLNRMDLKKNEQRLIDGYDANKGKMEEDEEENDDDDLDLDDIQKDGDEFSVIKPHKNKKKLIKIEDADKSDSLSESEIADDASLDSNDI